MFEYGLPCATRQSPFSQNNYIEWQIGYDVDVNNENLSLSTLANERFTSYNGKTKVFYELSECLYYFTQWGLIEITALRKLLTFLSALEEDALLTNHRDCKIKRTHPAEKTINNIDFLQLTLEYPQLIYKFEQYEIIAEITIREKQRAIGTQPMLYFCIPITEINANENLIGRVRTIKGAW
ncbi:MAG: R.Pab1 family restriction endonuclease [Candidatus Zeuxoniibacter abyssi]|nr:MAG: R.Pab1 family restriction endonuclease [Candidatus Persebacteraceae bacterium AB1(2)]